MNIYPKVSFLGKMILLQGLRQFKTDVNAKIYFSLCCSSKLHLFRGHYFVKAYKSFLDVL